MLSNREIVKLSNTYMRMKQTYCFFSTFAHRVLTVASARVKLLTAIALCLFSVGNVWGKTETSTFSSKDWGTETTSDFAWTSGKDGTDFEAKDPARGLAIQKNASGANATTQEFFSEITKIEVKYASSNKGTGTIKVSVGNGTAKSISVKSGTSLTTKALDFSSESGNVKIEVTCTNSTVYIHSVTITYNGVAQSTTVGLTQKLTHVTCTTTPLPTEIDKTAEEITLSYTATGDYVLPNNISATMGGVALDSEGEFEWTSASGTLYIAPAYGFTGDVTISIYGQLQAPTGLQTSDVTATSAKLTWNEVPNATGYVVLYTDGTEWVNPTSVNVGNTTSYVLQGLKPSKAYLWAVKAIDGDSPKTDSEESKASGDFQTLEPTKYYDITWYVNNTAVKTESIVEGTSLTATNLPTRPGDNTLTCGPNKFMGWTTAPIDGSTDEKPAPLYDHDYTQFLPVTANTNYYAVFAKAEGGTTEVVEDITDILTREVTGVPNQSPASYQSWSKKQITSEAMYSGNSAGGKNSIQLRASSGDQAKSGIVSTTSGGRLKKVVVEWNSNTTDGRKLDIYVKVDAYSAVGDLYDQVKRGARVGQIEYGTSTEYILPDTQRSSAKYVGLRSNSGAMWLNSVKIVWEKSSTGSSTTYSNYVTACEEEVCNLSEPSNPLSNNITSSGATLTWNAVSGATGYVVTLTAGGVSKEITTTTNSCELTDLQPATDYTWTVKATKGKCESAPCSTKEFTTLVPCTPLAMPTNVKVEWIGGDQYQLSWDKVTNATCYKITGKFSTTSIQQNYTIRTLSDLTRGREYSGTIIAMNPGDYKYCDSNPADYSFVYKPYRVTFNAGSGTCPVASSEETTIEELPEAQNNCEGWEFVGWSTIPCSETTTLPALVTAPYTPTSDHTLYAVYAKTEEGGQSNDFNSVDVDYGDLVSGEEYVLTAYNSVNKYDYALSCNETNIPGKYETKQISSVVIDEDNDGEGDFYQLTTTNTDIIWSLIGDGINGYYFKHVATGKCLINDAGNLLLSDTGEPIRFLISHPDATSYRVEVQLKKDESKYLSGYEKDNYGILFNIYTGSTLALYLYKRTSATIYTYSSNPSCKECVDAGAAFEQTLIKKKDIGISFVNPVTYATPNPSPAFYSSSDPSVATVDNTGKVTTVGMGSTIITLAQARYVTDSEQDVCAVEISYQLEVGVEMEIVEWETDGVILHIEKDDKANPQVVISGEHEFGNTGGNKAEDLFFSKYFEAAGTTKLLAVYNGTDHKISLSDIVVWHRESQKFSLAELGNKEKGFIYPNEEIIFFNKGEYSSCAETMEGYDRWFNVEAAALNFGGTGTLTLCRGETIIDMIGAYQDGKPKDGPQKPDWGDKPGFTCSNGVNYVTKESGYGLSTNRCLLIRNNTVVSGKNAVVKNSNGEFVTLCEEWSGLQIKKVDDAMTATCEGFKNVGIFDYSTYYKTLVTIDDTKTLDDYKHNEAENTYRIPIDGGVAQYSCLAMQFQLVDNNKKVLISKTVKVPILVTSEQATTDAIFSNIIADDYAASKERCKDCDVVVLGNATLTKVEAGTANDVNQVRSLKVYPGGKLVLPATSNDYTLNNIALRRKDDKVAKAELSGTPALSAPLPYSLDLYVSAENWHFFTLPYACNIADVTFANGSAAIYGRDWFLMYYDGAQRAATQDGGCWKSVDAGKTPVLEPGVGYIVGIAGYEKQTVRQELRFPMAAHDESGAKSVPVKAYGAGQDISPEHKGWNLVGNPYMNDYQKDNLNSFHGLTLGKLEWIGKNPVTYELSGNVPYLAKPIQNGWVGYEQVLVSETDLLPFTCYFVQVGNDGDTDGQDFAVLFDADRKVKSNIVRRAPAEYDAETDPVLVEVVLENAAGETDKTALVIGDNYTERYEIGADFVKMFGDAYRSYSLPVVYTVATDGKRAFNALPENAASQFVPLGMYAAQTGNYTFSLNQGYDLSRVAEVWLYDAESGTHTNLMQRDYTFTTVPTESSNRFSLSVRLLPKVVTSTEQLPAGVTLTSFDRTLHVGNLPQGAHLWVYDTTGKLLYSETAHNVQHVYPVTQAGVYYVRVESNLGNVTLRTIVK